MATERSPAVARATVAGGLAGLVGGLAFIAALSYGRFVLPVIADVYGYEGETGIQMVLGGILHLGHSFLFGAIFGALAGTWPLARWTQRPLGAAAVGLGYGVVLWLGASFLAPAIVVATTGWTVSVPFWDLGLLGVHVGFGLVVGLLHPWIVRWWGQRGEGSDVAVR